MRKRAVLGAAGRAGYAAPLAPFVLGSQVGVPTGTTLTPTTAGSITSTAGSDGTESLTLTHPLTGAQTTRTVNVWRRRRWSAQPTFRPGAGETWLFDECEFNTNAEFWACEIDDTNGVTDIMQPLAVFRRCTFDGNDTSTRSLLAGFSWVMNCHIANSEDGLGGGYYSVIMHSNLIGGDDGQFDPHADGFQNAGLGRTVLYHNWLSAGPDIGASQACRFGTEFSAVTDVKIYYCGFDLGGWMLQFRGDAGAGAGITDVTVVGCRWQLNGGFGPVDMESTTGVTWVDNKFIDGTVINSPV